VIVAGIPGIWMPPTALGVERRGATDMLVVHSELERDIVRGLLPRQRLRHVGLASLLAHDAEVGGTERPCVLFAPQALVPRTIEQRRSILKALIDTAAAHPEVDVVIKLRGTEGEAQTHKEFSSFPSLADELLPVAPPANLHFGYGPMRHYLGNCVGFVTVSSTAVIEAVQAGLPSICLDDFGVSEDQINVVFEGSGLFGSLDDLRALLFRHPEAEWLRRNYFHDSSADDWVDQVYALWLERDSGAPATIPVRDGLRDHMRGMRGRAIALGPEDVWWRRTLWYLVRGARRSYHWSRSWGRRAVRLQ
jgi:hypothetical protein